MPEVNPNFAREWVEFADPSNPEDLFKCDLTWLTSNWQCIYGDGCCGIDEGKPDSGCCSDGAYYTDKEDEARTLKAAQRLTPDMWQFYHEARPKRKSRTLNISEVGLDKDRKTRMVEGSCIFLNRKNYSSPGYTGSFGCVLHHLAQREGKHFAEVKPDVCWQLPLRRSWEKREMGEHEVTVTVIGEYERQIWGDGGNDFNWYCSSNTEAHTGRVPVYISNETELRLMMGDAAYMELKKLCDNRMELIRATKSKYLPLLNIHPATLAANK